MLSKNIKIKNLYPTPFNEFLNMLPYEECDKSDFWGKT